MDLVSRTYAEAVPGIRRGLPDSPVPAVAESLRPMLTAAFAGLPYQRIHGDCDLGNILLIDGDVTGFVDLDHLPIGPRVYDLGNLLANRALPLLDEPRRLKPFLAYAGRFIAGYHRTAPLAAAEVAATVPVMLAVELAFVDWFLHHQPDAEAVLRSERACIWLIDHRDQLAAAVVA